MSIQAVVKLLAPRWHRLDPVADVSDFDVVEARIGRRLPASYKFFMMWSNGGEFVQPERYLQLYPLEDLLSLFEHGQPEDCLEFGTDDGDGFAFDLTKRRDTARYPIVAYPLGDTDRKGIEYRADEFAEFLRSWTEALG